MGGDPEGPIQLGKLQTLTKSYQGQELPFNVFKVSASPQKVEWISTAGSMLCLVCWRINGESSLNSKTSGNPKGF